MKTEMIDEIIYYFSLSKIKHLLFIKNMTNCHFFQDREKAYAIKIKSLNKYDTPRCPHEMYGNFTAPQSFKYVV